MRGTVTVNCRDHGQRFSSEAGFFWSGILGMDGETFRRRFGFRIDADEEAGNGETDSWRFRMDFNEDV